VSLPYSNNRSRDPSPPPNYSNESMDSRGPLGIISRPDSRYSQYGAEASERSFDPSRQRAMTDTGREFIPGSYGNNVNQGERGQLSIDHLSQKFGSLPSLNSHANQQRMHSQQYQTGQQGHAPHALQRHQRSLSQPGPMRALGGQDHYQEEVHSRRGGEYGVGMSSHRLPPGMDNDYSMPPSDMRYHTQHSHQYGQHNNYSTGEGNHLVQGHGRSLSMTHGGMPPGAHEGGPATHSRRSSLQTMPNASPGFYGQGPNLPRRESLDFGPGHSRYSESVPVVATSEEMRIFTNSEIDRAGNNNYPRHERMVSPAHSPLHINYGSHSRHPSDMGNSSMSSSPMSLGSAGVVSTRFDDEFVLGLMKNNTNIVHL
jgi:hypothetical protein